ncbi:MAG: hypothetical protein LBC74_04890 [Planctomycetaceae bacterium]|jgi:hypothetical protein|nr:hypothetical protein [Planctomycetaceae bacterium]
MEKSQRQQIESADDLLFREYCLDGTLKEDNIGRNDIRPYLGTLPKNVLDIWAYSVSEMINNALIIPKEQY